MTQNQIRYMEAQETARANLAKEAETNRTNLAKEQETQRANKAQEALKVAELDYSKYGSGLLPSIIRSIKGVGSDLYTGVSEMAAASGRSAETSATSTVREMSTETREPQRSFGIYWPDITKTRAQEILDEFNTSGTGILSKMSEEERTNAIARLQQILSK